MKRQDINQQINEEILSGGGRTRALGTRSVLHNLADSTLNTSDHPQFTETPLASGSSNTYTAAYSEPITGYESGYLYKIDFGTANTGASTLNINSLGQKIIRRSNGSDLEAGDLEGVVLLAYTGSVFQLVGGTSMSSGDLVHRTGDETIDGVKTFEEIPVLPDADPEEDNEAVRKKYVDRGIGEIQEELTEVKMALESIAVEYTDRFEWEGDTIAIDEIEYPCVTLSHAPDKILSAHIDHVYVYSDEYAIQDNRLAFSFSNLVEGDIIEILYQSLS